VGIWICERNSARAGIHRTYKKLWLNSANEYIFDTSTNADNFFYTWTQLTHSPVPWFSAGYLVQRTRAFHTPLDIQRGPLVELTRKKATFATQIFDLGDTRSWSSPSDIASRVDSRKTAKLGETKNDRLSCAFLICSPTSSAMKLAALSYLVTTISVSLESHIP
jgi:hypothetical protein